MRDDNKDEASDFMNYSNSIVSSSSRLPQPKIKINKGLLPIHTHNNHTSISMETGKKKSQQLSQERNTVKSMGDDNGINTLDRHNNSSHDYDMEKASKRDLFDARLVANYDEMERRKASNLVFKLRQEQEDREKRRRLMVEAEGEIMKQEAALSEQKRKLIAEAAAHERAVQLEERVARAEREREEKWRRIEELRRLEREKAISRYSGDNVPLFKRMEKKFEVTVRYVNMK